MTSLLHHDDVKDTIENTQTTPEVTLSLPSDCALNTYAKSDIEASTSEYSESIEEGSIALHMDSVSSEQQNIINLLDTSSPSETYDGKVSDNFRNAPINLIPSAGNLMDTNTILLEFTSGVPCTQPFEMDSNSYVTNPFESFSIVPSTPVTVKDESSVNTVVEQDTTSGLQDSDDIFGLFQPTTKSDIATDDTTKVSMTSTQDNLSFLDFFETPAEEGLQSSEFLKQRDSLKLSDITDRNLLDVAHENHAIFSDANTKIADSDNITSTMLNMTSFYGKHTIDVKPEVPIENADSNILNHNMDSGPEILIASFETTNNDSKTQGGYQQSEAFSLINSSKEMTESYNHTEMIVAADLTKVNNECRNELNRTEESTSTTLISLGMNENAKNPQSEQVDIGNVSSRDKVDAAVQKLHSIGYVSKNDNFDWQNQEHQTATDSDLKLNDIDFISVFEGKEGVQHDCGMIENVSCEEEHVVSIQNDTAGSKVNIKEADILIKSISTFKSFAENHEDKNSTAENATLLSHNQASVETLSGSTSVTEFQHLEDPKKNINKIVGYTGDTLLFDDVNMLSNAIKINEDSNANSDNMKKIDLPSSIFFALESDNNEVIENNAVEPDKLDTTSAGKKITDGNSSGINDASIVSSDVSQNCIFEKADMLQVQQEYTSSGTPDDIENLMSQTNLYKAHSSFGDEVKPEDETTKIYKDINDTFVAKILNGVVAELENGSRNHEDIEENVASLDDFVMVSEDDVTGLSQNVNAENQIDYTGHHKEITNLGNCQQLQKDFPNLVESEDLMGLFIAPVTSQHQVAISPELPVPLIETTKVFINNQLEGPGNSANNEIVCATQTNFPLSISVNETKAITIDATFATIPSNSSNEMEDDSVLNAHCLDTKDISKDECSGAFSVVDSNNMTVGKPPKISSNQFNETANDNRFEPALCSNTDSMPCNSSLDIENEIKECVEALCAKIVEMVDEKMRITMNELPKQSNDASEDELVLVPTDISLSRKENDISQISNRSCDNGLGFVSDVNKEKELRNIQFDTELPHNQPPPDMAYAKTSDLLDTVKCVTDMQDHITTAGLSIDASTNIFDEKVDGCEMEKMTSEETVAKIMTEPPVPPSRKVRHPRKSTESLQTLNYTDDKLTAQNFNFNTNVMFNDRDMLQLNNSPNLQTNVAENSLSILEIGTKEQTTNKLQTFIGVCNDTAEVSVDSSEEESTKTLPVVPQRFNKFKKIANDQGKNLTLLQDDDTVREELDVSLSSKDVDDTNRTDGNVCNMNCSTNEQQNFTNEVKISLQNNSIYDASTNLSDENQVSNSCDEIHIHKTLLTSCIEEVEVATIKDTETKQLNLVHANDPHTPEIRKKSLSSVSLENELVQQSNPEHVTSLATAFVDKVVLETTDIESKSFSTGDQLEASVHTNDLDRFENLQEFKLQLSDIEPIQNSSPDNISIFASTVVENVLESTIADVEHKLYSTVDESKTSLQYPNSCIEGLGKFSKVERVSGSENESVNGSDIMYISDVESANADEDPNTLDNVSQISLEFDDNPFTAATPVPPLRARRKVPDNIISSFGWSESRLSNISSYSLIPSTLFLGEDDDDNDQDGLLTPEDVTTAFDLASTNPILYGSNLPISQHYGFPFKGINNNETFVAFDEDWEDIQHTKPMVEVLPVIMELPEPEDDDEGEQDIVGVVLKTRDDTAAEAFDFESNNGNSSTAAESSNYNSIQSYTGIEVTEQAFERKNPDGDMIDESWCILEIPNDFDESTPSNNVDNIVRDIIDFILKSVDLSDVISESEDAQKYELHSAHESVSMQGKQEKPILYHNEITSQTPVLNDNTSKIIPCENVDNNIIPTGLLDEGPEEDIQPIVDSDDISTVELLACANKDDNLVDKALHESDEKATTVALESNNISTKCTDLITDVLGGVSDVEATRIDQTEERDHSIVTIGHEESQQDLEIELNKESYQDVMSIMPTQTQINESGQDISNQFNETSNIESETPSESYVSDELPILHDDANIAHENISSQEMHEQLLQDHNEIVFQVPVVSINNGKSVTCESVEDNIVTTDLLDEGSKDIQPALDSDNIDNVELPVCENIDDNFVAKELHEIPPEIAKTVALESHNISMKTNNLLIDVLGGTLGADATIIDQTEERDHNTVIIEHEESQQDLENELNKESYQNAMSIVLTQINESDQDISNQFTETSDTESGVPSGTYLSDALHGDANIAQEKEEQYLQDYNEVTSPVPVVSNSSRKNITCESVDDNIVTTGLLYEGYKHFQLPIDSEDTVTFEMPVCTSHDDNFNEEELHQSVEKATTVALESNSISTKATELITDVLGGVSDVDATRIDQTEERHRNIVTIEHGEIQQDLENELNKESCQDAMSIVLTPTQSNESDQDISNQFNETSDIESGAQSESYVSDELPILHDDANIAHENISSQETHEQLLQDHNEVVFQIPVVSINNGKSVACESVEDNIVTTDLLDEGSKDIQPALASDNIENVELPVCENNDDNFVDEELNEIPPEIAKTVALESHNISMKSNNLLIDVLGGTLGADATIIDQTEERDHNTVIIEHEESQQDLKIELNKESYQNAMSIVLTQINESDQDISNQFNETSDTESGVPSGTYLSDALHGDANIAQEKEEQYLQDYNEVTSPVPVVSNGSRKNITCESVDDNIVTTGLLNEASKNIQPSVDSGNYGTVELPACAHTDSDLVDKGLHEMSEIANTMTLESNNISKKPIDLITDILEGTSDVDAAIINQTEEKHHNIVTIEHEESHQDISNQSTETSNTKIQTKSGDNVSDEILCGDSNIAQETQENYMPDDKEIASQLLVINANSNKTITSESVDNNIVTTGLLDEGYKHFQPPIDSEDAVTFEMPVCTSHDDNFNEEELHQSVEKATTVALENNNISTKATELITDILGGVPDVDATRIDQTEERDHNIVTIEYEESQQDLEIGLNKESYQDAMSIVLTQINESDQDISNEFNETSDIESGVLSGTYVSDALHGDANVAQEKEKRLLQDYNEVTSPVPVVSSSNENGGTCADIDDNIVTTGLLDEGSKDIQPALDSDNIDNVELPVCANSDHNFNEEELHESMEKAATVTLESNSISTKTNNLSIDVLEGTSDVDATIIDQTEERDHNIVTIEHKESQQDLENELNKESYQDAVLIVVTQSQKNQSNLNISNQLIEVSNTKSEVKFGDNDSEEVLHGDEEGDINIASIPPKFDIERQTIPNMEASNNIMQFNNKNSIDLNSSQNESDVIENIEPKILQNTKDNSISSIAGKPNHEYEALFEIAAQECVKQQSTESVTEKYSESFSLKTVDSNVHPYNLDYSGKVKSVSLIDQSESNPSSQPIDLLSDYPLMLGIVNKGIVTPLNMEDSIKQQSLLHESNTDFSSSQRDFGDAKSKGSNPLAEDYSFQTIENEFADSVSEPLHTGNAPGDEDAFVSPSVKKKLALELDTTTPLEVTEETSLRKIPRQRYDTIGSIDLLTDSEEELDSTLTSPKSEGVGILVSLGDEEKETKLPPLPDPTINQSCPTKRRPLVPPSSLVLSVALDEINVQSPVIEHTEIGLEAGQQENIEKDRAVLPNSLQNDSDDISHAENPSSAERGKGAILLHNSDQNAENHSIPQPSVPVNYSKNIEWETIMICNKEYKIDGSVLLPYKKAISHGGFFKEKCTIVEIFGSYLPDSSINHYNWIIENLFLYLLSTIELLVQDKEYVIVFFNNSVPKSRFPSTAWLKKSHQLVPTFLRKNLKEFYVVQTSFYMKTLINFTRMFLSRKALKKVKHVKNHKELKQHMPVDFLFIPEEITGGRK